MIPRTQERFRYRYRLPKKTHCRESMVTAENKIIIPLFCQSYYLIFLNPIYKRICTHVKCTFIEFQANIMSTGKSRWSPGMAPAPSLPAHTEEPPPTPPPAAISPTLGRLAGYA